MTLIERLRNRVNDSNMGAERLMDDAADALEAAEVMVEALRKVAADLKYADLACEALAHYRKATQ